MRPIFQRPDLAAIRAPDRKPIRNWDLPGRFLRRRRAVSR
jgi:hypothetical protein